MKNLVLFLSSILFLTGCGRQDSSPAADRGPAVPVKVEVVQAETFAYREAVPGQVRPAHSAVLSARLQGQVSRISARPGQRVKQGEVLAVLVSEELGARARRAQAELEAARLELDRITGLIEARAATRQELEGAEVRHRSAQASQEEAETFLGYAEVVAPFDGIITRKHVDAGDLVSPGQPLIDLLVPDLFRIEAWVPESLTAAVELGADVRFDVASAEASGTGRITEIGATSDPATRTLLVKVDLPENPAMRSGQYSRIYLPGSETQRLTVPTSALIRRGQLEYLFVVQEDRARLRLVRAGRPESERTEILAGLAEEDIVVAEIPANLRDGQPVEIQQ
jgi:membrane fusion protein, multidrug efflux system